MPIVARCTGWRPGGTRIPRGVNQAITASGIRDNHLSHRDQFRAVGRGGDTRPIVARSAGPCPSGTRIQGTINRAVANVFISSPVPDPLRLNHRHQFGAVRRRGDGSPIGVRRGGRRPSSARILRTINRAVANKNIIIVSRIGNPPALPEDSRSWTAPGVVAESVFRELLKVYERTDSAYV